MSAITDQITTAANSAGVPASLALAVAKQESNYNQNAVSKAGAIGVMQLMPGTAAGLGVNPYDASQNIAGGVTYLSQQLDAFGGDQEKALAAYNAGPGRVQQAVNQAGADWLSVMPAETQNYVARILGPSYSPPASGSILTLPATDTTSAGDILSFDLDSISADLTGGSSSDGAAPLALVAVAGAAILAVVLVT